MNIAEFEKRKVEYITNEAELTKEEASKFFPVYNELTKKKFDLHKAHRDKVEKMKTSKENMSNEEYRKLLDNDVDVKLKEAELVFNNITGGILNETLRIITRVLSQFSRLAR